MKNDFLKNTEEMKYRLKFALFHSYYDVSEPPVINIRE